MGKLLLYVTVVLVATCGLVYELVAGAVSTYLLGDSVTQLSTVIGVHLSAMGVGAWLSKYVEERVAERFVDCQIAASFVGGLGGPVLYLTFAQSSHVRLVLYLLVASTGVLVGAEIPLLMRVLKRRVAFKDVVPRVLSLDYAGALVGALVFALLLLPSLGILRTGVVFGILGVLSALWGTWVLGSSLEPRPLRIRALRRARRCSAARSPPRRRSCSSPTRRCSCTPSRSPSRPSTSASCSRRRGAASACSSTETCSLHRSTSIATTRRSFTRRSRSPRGRRTCSCSAAATGSRCARSSGIPR